MSIAYYSGHDSGHDEAGGGIIRTVSSLAIPLILGGIVTVGLLYLMQSLIASGQVDLDEGGNVHLVDFVRVPEASEVKVKDRKPKKPPPPEEAPPPVESVQFNVAVNEEAWSMDPVLVEDTGGMSNAFSFVSDGNYLPIVKVQPVYPRVALARGLEGWVVLEFTVDEQGRVVDPEVLENCAQVARPGSDDECWDMPNPIFDHSAMRAATKFKYKPKVENGQPVATHHVRHKITFQLEDEPS